MKYFVYFAQLSIAFVTCRLTGIPGSVATRHHQVSIKLASCRAQRLITVLVFGCGLLCGHASAVTPSGNCAPLLPGLTENAVKKISLNLGIAESRLLVCNREVLAAQHALEAAEADRVTAGQRPNPNLTLGASNINPHAGVGAGPLQDKTIDSSLRLDQLVERGGKAVLREQQADAMVKAARADGHDVLRQQRLLLRQNYFELLFQQARIDMQREFVRYAHESLSAVEQRLKVGDIALSEANRFRLDEMRAQNDLRQAETDARKAQLELAKSIGAEASAFDIGVQPAKLPDLDAGLFPAGAQLEQRPDLIAATNRVEAAEAARALVRSIATRDVTVSAQFDRWPASTVNPQGTGNSFGLYFSIPLSVRHANEGEVQRAATDLQVARDSVVRLETQAKAEVRLYLNGWQAATDRVARIERSILPLAREVARAAEFAYSKGATTALDLLDARRNLKQIELDSAQANSDAGKAWAQWCASTEMMTEVKL